jgi:hypothetical protein
LALNRRSAFSARTSPSPRLSGEEIGSSLPSTLSLSLSSSSSLEQRKAAVLISLPSRGCNKSFVSLAALTLHFESGTCPSRMTREQLKRLVVRADTNNYITNASRLITGPLGWNEPPPSATTWPVGDRALAEWGRVRVLLCNATFRSHARLNQCLQSPRHEDKTYRCPKTDCRTEFATLSGLCQHVEGGSCGVRMFRRVRDTMESLTRSLNMLTVRE